MQSNTQQGSLSEIVGSSESSRAVAAGLDIVSRDRGRFVEAYQVDGFALVKGLFSLDEVVALRAICADIFARADGKLADLATYPELRAVVLDARVLAVARAVLGQAITYFGDSNFFANSRFDRHIHNDARGDVEDPSCSEYPLLRMGIYLQDHAFHSNGLKVRPGSHRSVFWTPRNAMRLVGLFGKRLKPAAFRPRWFYNVPTEPGDLVFWNLRTHHAGHAVRLRGADGLALPPALEGYLPARVQRPMPKDRFAVFMSWARESPALDAYIKQIGYANRSWWQRCSFDSRVSRDDFDAHGVGLRTDVLRLSQLGA